MSSDEKKYNIDDILAEYEKNDDAPAEYEVEEITDDSVDSEETDNDHTEAIPGSAADHSSAEEIITADSVGDEETDNDYSEDMLEPVTDIDSDTPADIWWEDSIISEETAEEITETEETEESKKEMSEETVTKTPEETTETEEPKKEMPAETESTEEETEKPKKETSGKAENNEAETKETAEQKKETKTENSEAAAAETLAEKVPESSAKTEENVPVSEEDDVNEKWVTRFLKGIFPIKGDSVFEVIRKIIFIIAVTVFIGAGIMLASTLIQSKKAVSDQSEARSLIETTVASYIDEYGNTVTIPPTEEEIEEHNRHVAEFYRQINEDYIGYLEIDGCEIYEPVVKGEDNDYYLRHTLKGEYNKAGTIFMDHRCTVSKEYTSPNIVIYGHNQEDGSMFGRLKYYKQDVDFYSKHPVIRFNPEFENGEYVIYGFFVTNALESQDSNGEVFHYQDYIEAMNDIYTFNWYQREVQSRNQIISPVDVKYGDKLLCLSTCSTEFTDSRFVVFARKLRDGESVSDFDFSETRLNPDARGIDWGAVLSGETSSLPDEDDTIEETTWKKSLNKRNEKTVTETETESEETSSETEKKTKKSTKTEAAEETSSVSETETETEAVTTAVPETDADGETLTETAGSTEEERNE